MCDAYRKGERYGMRCFFDTHKTTAIISSMKNGIWKGTFHDNVSYNYLRVNLAALVLMMLLITFMKPHKL